MTALVNCCTRTCSHRMMKTLLQLYGTLYTCTNSDHPLWNREGKKSITPCLYNLSKSIFRISIELDILSLQKKISGSGERKSTATCTEHYSVVIRSTKMMTSCVKWVGLCHHNHYSLCSPWFHNIQQCLF